MDLFLLRLTSSLFDSHGSDTRQSCPASSKIFPWISGIHSYPDFGQDTNNGVKSFNCTSTPYPNLQILNCPFHSICPIHKEDVDTARKKSTIWDYKHSLCTMRSAIQNCEPVKMIVYGGSVTAGAATWGCCCDPDVDSRCPPFTGEKATDTINRKGCGSGDVANRCRWTSFLETWFASQACGEVKVYNYGQGGATSVYRCWYKLLQQHVNLKFATSFKSSTALPCALVL